MNFKQNKLALIFGNGEYNNPFYYKYIINKYPNAFIIAADGGFNFLKSIGIKPNLIIGDMDSVKYGYKDFDFIKVPTEKDETDTRLALDYCVDNNFNPVILLGMTSQDRIDHSLANIFLLEKYAKKGLEVYLKNQYNEIGCVKGPVFIEFSKMKGNIFSLLPLSDKVEDVTLEGVKYPITNKDIFRESTDFTISNVIISQYCSISFKKGILLIDIVSAE